MIKRKIDKRLEQFYASSNKALLVTGARQIGKTFSVRQFGEAHFDSFVEINFIDNRQYVEVFSTATSAQDLLLKLSTLTRKPLIPGKTLIFFDEVQECPDIVTMIKFLVDEGSYRYVLSGSLLGVYLNDLRSVPVGYMDVMDMYPMDLEEFALAVGIPQNVLDKIGESYADATPVDDFLHKRMMEVFRLYLVVGGMPAAVQKYLDTNNLQLVLEEQKGIVRMYHHDISKYDRDNKLYIAEIFDRIPAELNSKNKRFILKNLNENIKFARYENSFLWLKDAGVALPTYNVEEPAVPLLLASTRNLFKLFLSDVGLLASLYADGIQTSLLVGDANINFGAIYENVVAQELHAHGFPLYYYNNKRQGELDFIVERHGRVLPIEVKSGKDYERHRALANIMTSEAYDIEEALVLCNGNVQKKVGVTYLPIYMVMFLHRDESAPTHYVLDLSGL